MSAMGVYRLKLVQIRQEWQQVSQGSCRGLTHDGMAVSSHLVEDGQDEGCPHLRGHMRG